jgi:hypothetical protein
MKFLALLAVVASLFIGSPLAFAKTGYSAQQCKSWFNKIDSNSDGSIGQTENADMFLARITLASETDKSGGSFIMSRSFFLAECAIGSLGKPQK